MVENKKIIPANTFFSSETKKTNLIIVADNLKTPENMGAVIRIAGNFAAEKVIFINKESININKINRFSASVANLVETHYISDTNELKSFFDDSYKIICLDTEINANNITQYKFPEKIVLVVGNEKHGISQEILDIADESIFIPMIGKVKSMNVTHALVVAIYDYVKKSLF